MSKYPPLNAKAGLVPLDFQIKYQAKEASKQLS